MSLGCGGREPQALEIRNDKELYRILTDGSRVPINKFAASAKQSQEEVHEDGAIKAWAPWWWRSAPAPQQPVSGSARA